MKRIVLAPQRLITFLQDITGYKYSGKYLRRILEANLCRVNGRIERFASSPLQKGVCVELAPSWKDLLSSEKQIFNILYEDEALRLVDKPSGWVCSEENCSRIFGCGFELIHRLDKDTTGVLALAKGSQAKEKWISLFSEKAVKKDYYAVVDGILREEEGVVENTLIRKGKFQGQTIWGSGKSGLHAVTRWKVLARGKKASLLLCQPITGRTHQIRVHLSEMGHPILIDRQYAASFRCPLFVRRPLLHAFRLQLGTVKAQAPLPQDFRRALLCLGLQCSQEISESANDTGTWQSKNPCED